MHKNFKLNIAVTPDDAIKLEAILTGTGKVKGGLYCRIKKFLKENASEITPLPEIKKSLISYEFTLEEEKQLKFLAKKEGISVQRLIEKHVVIPILLESK